jgi:CDP-glucose 4,6-dehydratase
VGQRLPAVADDALTETSAAGAAAAPERFWLDRSTLVTGAAGLLGAATVRALLERGAEVVCLLRDWVPASELRTSGLVEECVVVRGDQRDQPLLERLLGEHEVRTVLHLGAQTIVGVANRNPVSTWESNVAGTWSLLEACRRSPLVEQIVVASSDKAYGAQPTLPYTEDMPLLARHPYDASKACTELVASSYAATYGLPVAVTRCGNLFGAGDLNWNRIVPGTIRSVLRHTPPVIRSDGRFVRDYFYVEDAATANLLLAERLASEAELVGEAFNFSSEEPLQVLDVVDRILRVMGSELVPEIRDEATHEIREQYLSAEKARSRLGWRPQFGLDDALRRTVEWYREVLAPA